MGKFKGKGFFGGEMVSYGGKGLQVQGVRLVEEDKDFLEFISKSKDNLANDPRDDVITMGPLFFSLHLSQTWKMTIIHVYRYKFILPSISSKLSLSLWFP